ncbi:MAG: response regulator transcription factor [Rubrivivax sp.]|nr:response regulator transcription factor [Rubrivivax sp.]
MRLLLAEDDVLLGEAVSRGLMQLGYAVDWLTSGERLRLAVKNYTYDCILLDLGLPDVPGDTCLRLLRQEKLNTPVIVITARDGKSDKIRVLDGGADDYVSKPFDLEELAARIRAVVRRGAERAEAEQTVDFMCGTLELHTGSQAVLLGGQPKMLTTKEFWLLEAMVRNRHRIVTRQMLEERLYGWGDELTSNTIEVYVHQLRRKLGKDLIKTVRGLGYRLARTDEF